jgi:DNA-binding NarL/FixJ family response regulator
MNALRCLIVDDSPALLRSARELLERQGIAVVGVAATGEEALRLVRDLRPDVTLVDVALGPDSGFEVARRVGDTTASILISMHDEGDFADLVAASPAVGFLAKSQLSAAAIRRLLEAARERGRY